MEDQENPVLMEQSDGVVIEEGAGGEGTEFHDPGVFFRGRGFSPQRGPPRFLGGPPQMMMGGPPPQHMNAGPPGTMMRRPPPPGFRGPPPQHGNFDPNFRPQGMPPGMHPGMPPPGMQPPGMQPPGMQPPGMQPPGMQSPGIPGMRPLLPPMNVPPPGYGIGMSPTTTASSTTPSSSSYTIAGIDFSGEVWVETKSGEGKSYYYNAKTREVSWSKPENVKILTQEQIEVVAAAAGVTPASQSYNQTTAPTSVDETSPSAQETSQATTEDQDSNSMTGIENTNNNSSSPPDDEEPKNTPGESLLETPPASELIDPNKVVPISQPPPAAAILMTPGAPMNMFQGAPFGMAPHFGAPMQGGVPGFNMPPPGFQPQMMGFPGQGDPAAMMQQMSGGDDSQSDSQEKVDIAELQAKAAEWTEHQTTDGRFYYYNAGTAQSVWEKPEAILKLDNAKMQQSKRNGPISLGAKGDMHLHKVTNGEENSMEMDESRPTIKELERDAMTLAKEDAREREVEKERAKIESQKPMDKSRPVSSNNVPGTPWCVVWTGDGRVFFFNPSTKTSVWEKPEELKGRPDVDKLTHSAPPVVLQAVAAAKKAKEEEEPSPKKMKVDDGIDDAPATKISFGVGVAAAAPEEPSPQASTNNNSNKRKIDVGKEAAIEAELRAAKERAAIPLDIRMKQFRDMLVEKEVSAFSTWEKELHKIVFDPRYLLLTSKERKQVFEKYVKERAEEERREKRNKMKERKDDFRRLLEGASISLKSTFSDFAQKYGKDERFKNIDKMREKESMFSDYIQELRRKDRDERSSQRERTKKDYFELLSEQKGLDKHSRWSETKKGLGEDPRYKAVESSSQREDWFKDFINKLDDANDEATKEREKQERIEASIREREKEVQRTLSTHLRERDKEREQHKHDEAVQHFTALLADLVRNSDASWKDAKRTLRKDHRWELVSPLERDERERLFQQHVDNLSRKKKEKFRELLDETTSITFSTSWKEVRKLIRDDPRYSKFSSSDRKCEKEFKEYMKDKMVAAKADFRELLKETKLITYKSRKMIDEAGQHLEDIENVLENDKRYLVLDCNKEERKKLLMSYIDDLDRRGPPPPPTASEPSRRSTK